MKGPNTSRWNCDMYLSRKKLCRVQRYKKITLPFYSTLALIAILRPTFSGLQTGGYNFREKRKFQLVKPGAQLSILASFK